MSRFTEWENYDVESLLAEGRWIARRNKVLGGRPGQAALRELERALVNLPHKQLIEGSICDGTGVCGVGAMAYQHYRDQGMSPKTAWKEIQKRPKFFVRGEELDYTQDFAVKVLGWTQTLAEVVAWMNDEASWRLTPERRYRYVLEWTRQHMGREEIGV